MSQFFDLHPQSQRYSKRKKAAQKGRFKRCIAVLLGLKQQACFYAIP
jgi:hypothetical protein